MPIPFILGAIGIGTALLGIGKGVKAGVDNHKAKGLNEDANSLLETSKEMLDISRKASGVSLEELGRKKIFVLDESVSRFVATFEKLKNVELQNSAGMTELLNLKIDAQALKELKEMSNFATSVASGAVGGALGGALTAFGAYSGAMMFASASTGTAIATLSGAAATNATLAFFGGGSLAAGGLGMAGGAAVLGGLVAGPALAIMGFVMGAKASKNLDNARSNYAEARKTSEEMKLAAFMCNSIRRRSYMFIRLLIRLETLFLPLVYRMESIVKKRGDNFQKFKQDEKEDIAKTAALVMAIKSVLDTPILTEDGKLTDTSGQIADDMRQKTLPAFA